MVDTPYGIRRDGDNFKIGNSKVTVDNMSNNTIKGKQFKGAEDSWKLLTRKNISFDIIDQNELQKYKTILGMTNAHLEGYKAGSNIQTSRGIKFKNVLAKLFAEAKVATRRMKRTSDQYYDPAKPSAFSILKKLQNAAKQSKLVKKPGEIMSWLEMHDAYTIHKPLRFPSIPYTVNNLLDVWESDRADVQALSKFNDNYKYLLTVIDAVSKFLHIVPLKSRMRIAVMLAFK